VTNSVLGREGLERQVTTRVNNIIESQKERSVVLHEQELFVKCEQHQQRDAMKFLNFFR
jgi:hypothetical protein